MKKVIYLFLAAALSAVVFTGCNSNEEPKKELKLSVDKDLITADDTDKATFTVTYDGKAVTDAVISTGSETLDGYLFTTSEEGEYKFTASYEGQTSNEVTVNAEALSEALVISADKNEVSFASGEEVTFTVKFNGEDVTASSQICAPGDEGLCLTSNVWLPVAVGEFTYYAKYEESDVQYESNEITITVVE